jgi:hypothetical protein
MTLCAGPQLEPRDVVFGDVENRCDHPDGYVHRVIGNRVQTSGGRGGIEQSGDDFPDPGGDLAHELARLEGALHDPPVARVLRGVGLEQGSRPAAHLRCFQHRACGR